MDFWNCYFELCGQKCMIQEKVTALIAVLIMVIEPSGVHFCL